MNKSLTKKSTGNSWLAADKKKIRCRCWLSPVASDSSIRRLWCWEGQRKFISARRKAGLLVLRYSVELVQAQFSKGLRKARKNSYVGLSELKSKRNDKSNLSFSSMPNAQRKSIFTTKMRNLHFWQFSKIFFVTKQVTETNNSGDL